jgi:hypothetical protein
MNTGGVLLVDDVPGERANFEHAFGPDLTVAPSIDQLNEQLRRGLTWDLAFVDFNLSSQTSTGLTALLGYTTSVRLPRSSPTASSPRAVGLCTRPPPIIGSGRLR